MVCPDAFGLIWKKKETRTLILEKKPIRGSGKTADFKPATFRGFRNVAEKRVSDSDCQPSQNYRRNIDSTKGLKSSNVGVFMSGTLP